MGLDKVKQITGLHGWVGRVAASFGMKSPIKAKPGPSGGAIWDMDPEVRAIFGQWFTVTEDAKGG